MIQRLLLTVISLFLIQSVLLSQADTEFWFVGPEVDAGHGDDPIFLHLSGTNQGATVTISQPNNPAGYSNTTTVGAGATVSLNITNFKNQLENRPANQVLNKALKITSTTPITAYYEVANPLNPEIFPLKGKTALGLSFFIPGQNTYANQVGTPAFDIVATQNNTTVTITPSSALVGRAAGVPFTIVLNEGETFSCVGTDLSAAGTLAGSKVTSNKPIAITHSDDSLFNNGAWDLIGDQIVPVSVLGTEYIAVKGQATNERIYIVATEDNTTYYLNGISTATVNISTGQVQSYAIAGNAISVNSDKPVYVMHLSGFGTEMGDALLPPIVCTGSSATNFVRTAGTGNFTILVLTTTGDEGNFTLNGNATSIPASAFFPIPGNPNYVGARINLSTAQAPVGTNIIENSSGLFHIGILNELNLSAEYGYFSSYSTVNLGEDRVLCVSDLPLELDGGQNADSYLWQDGSTNRFFDVTQSGQYIVQTTLNSCIITDTVNVIVSDPQVDLGADTAICQGQSISFDVTQPDVTYLWNDSTTAATYTASQEETVYVRIISPAGCEASDTVEVVYPIADLKGDTTVCQGTTFTLFSNVLPQFATSYTWNTGATGSSIEVTQSGQYWVDIIADIGCISTDTIQINFQVPPTITITEDTLLCPNESVEISATVPNMRNILWSNGVSDTTQNVSMEMYYVATITDSIYCVIEDSVFVGIAPLPFVNLGNDTIICDGEPIFLTPEVSSASSYIWNDGSTDSSLEILIPGTYSVAILDENSCPASDSVYVDVLASLVQTLPSDTTICQDIILELNAYQPTATSYKWTGESAFYQQNEVTDSIFLVTYAGSYSVEMENLCGGITQYIEVTKEDCTCEPFIPDAFTPNNDGNNDNFRIFANCDIQDFEMNLYDRWGSRVFTTTDWQTGWSGEYNGNILQPGVYVYYIKYTAANKNGIIEETTKQGSVTLVR